MNKSSSIQFQRGRLDLAHAMVGRTLRVIRTRHNINDGLYLATSNARSPFRVTGLTEKLQPFSESLSSKTAGVEGGSRICVAEDSQRENVPYVSVFSPGGAICVSFWVIPQEQADYAVREGDSLPGFGVLFQGLTLDSSPHTLINHVLSLRIDNHEHYVSGLDVSSLSLFSAMESGPFACRTSPLHFEGRKFLDRLIGKEVRFLFPFLGKDKSSDLMSTFAAMLNEAEEMLGPARNRLAAEFIELGGD